MIKSVSVYCASSTLISEQYLNDAKQIGELLASENIDVVYGGGSVGAMGALANGVLEKNGKLIGVIPQFMVELEWGNPNVTEMHIVNNMAERKQQFIKRSDAIVALPGGTGTLEELVEALSLKKLGLCPKPIVILNSNGFYNYLIKFIEHMIGENFLHPEHLKLFSVANNATEVLEQIKNAPDWSEKALKLAAL